jgi:hypothetical protein
MGLKRLAEAIVDLSCATNFESAVMEWNIEDIWKSDEPSTCLCGHNPIHEHCLLRNVRNGNAALVGNVCVTRFMGIESKPLFDSFKRVAKDSSKSLSEVALTMLFDHYLITQWEFNFYCSILGKRSLSAKQRAKKEEINRKAAEHLKRKPDTNSRRVLP